jgi:hypothetical protein
VGVSDTRAFEVRADEARQEAWRLLDEAKHILDARSRKELLARAFELAQLAAQLENCW